MLEKNLSLLKIITYGHPVLIQKAAAIQDITEDIEKLARSMAHTMHSTPGIGLAAPQVNQSIRLITVDLSVGEKEHDLFILINPEIVNQEGEWMMEEGCLSVPEINEKVKRPVRVVVKGIDLKGKEVTIEAENLLARVFCHEVDHLEGKLFIEHLSPLKRDIIKRKLKKQMKTGKTS
jgi:peptide deformylase